MASHTASRTAPAPMSQSGGSTSRATRNASISTGVCRRTAASRSASPPSEASSHPPCTPPIIPAFSARGYDVTSIVEVATEQRQVGGAEAVAGVQVVPERIRKRLRAEGVEPLDVRGRQLQVHGGEVVGEL